MADKKHEGVQGKTQAHFEAVKDFFKKKNKNVHLPRLIRKEIAKLKTLENQGKNE
jgi:hypothetical protein